MTTSFLVRRANEFSLLLAAFSVLAPAVVRAASPAEPQLPSSSQQALRSFLQSTYEAGANLAHWDRKELERA